MTVTTDAAEENRQLRGRLAKLVDQARQNERTLSQFQSIELRLISSTALFPLFDTLLTDFRKSFDLDLVTIALKDPEYEIQRILDFEGAHQHKNELIFASDQFADKRFQGLGMQPLLGPHDDERFHWLFPTNRRLPTSVAILPLSRYGKLIGSLNLGSYLKDRFQPTDATDFLTRLSAITSVCLENTINRIRLEQLGLTDALTRISNRRFFDRRLSEEVARARRYNDPLSCLFLDVDHFKKVNDTYGHAIGDWVLKEVAHQFMLQMRGSDVLARYGGEEFAALLPKTNIEEALQVSERIRHAISEYEFAPANTEPFQVTVSIGVAMLYMGDLPDGDRSSEETLVTEADAALYKAKQTGRNRVVRA